MSVLHVCLPQITFTNLTFSLCSPFYSFYPSCAASIFLASQVNWSTFVRLAFHSHKLSHQTGLKRQIAHSSTVVIARYRRHLACPSENVSFMLIYIQNNNLNHKNKSRVPSQFWSPLTVTQRSPCATSVKHPSLKPSPLGGMKCS